MPIRTLYLCYFGLREPLVQTQVLPYLQCLARAGIEVHLLTFEPNAKRDWTESLRLEWTERLIAHGIHWSFAPYHKKPSLPATLFDIVAGAIAARRIVSRHGIHIVHARAHVPAAMAALIKRFARVRVVFDIRGFNPE